MTSKKMLQDMDSTQTTQAFHMRAAIGSGNVKKVQELIATNPKVLLYSHQSYNVLHMIAEAKSEKKAKEIIEIAEFIIGQLKAKYPAELKEMLEMENAFGKTPIAITYPDGFVYPNKSEIRQILKEQAGADLIPEREQELKDAAQHVEEQKKARQDAEANKEARKIRKAEEKEKEKIRAEKANQEKAKQDAGAWKEAEQKAAAEQKNPAKAESEASETYSKSAKEFLEDEDVPKLIADEINQLNQIIGTSKHLPKSENEMVFDQADFQVKDIKENLIDLCERIQNFHTGAHFPDESKEAILKNGINSLNEQIDKINNSQAKSRVQQVVNGAKEKLDDLIERDYKPAASRPGS